MIFPTNDAEYAWILNVLNFDKSRDPKKINSIKIFGKYCYLDNLFYWDFYIRHCACLSIKFY